MSENLIVKRLLWSGLVTALGAVATIAAQKVATKIWEQIFDEDPPE